MWSLISGETTYNVYSPTIHRQLKGLNYIECTLAEAPTIGSVVDFKCDDSTIFHGSISEIRRVSNGNYTVKLVELANNLKMMYVHSGSVSTGENRVVQIENDGTKTMGDYVDAILNDTGWTDGTADPRTTNPVSESPFDNIAFNNSTCYEALYQFISTTCGYNLWFDNVSQTVYYGAKGTLGVGRTDRGAIDTYIIDVNDMYSAISYGVDRIIVIGSTDNTGTHYEGSWPTTDLPDYPKTLIYQYELVKSNDEAATIAKQIYNERSTPKERFEIIINPSQIDFYEGDLINYNGSNYSVIDVTISDESVVLGIKASTDSIFDRLGSQLQLIEGGAFTGAEVVWDGGWQSIPQHGVGYPGTSYVDEGDHGEWNFNVTNLDFVSDLNMTINVDCYMRSIELGEAYTGVSVQPLTPSGSAYNNTTGVAVVDPTAVSLVYTANAGVIHYGNANIFDGTTIEFNNTYTPIITLEIPEQDRLDVPMEIGLANIDMIVGAVWHASRMIEFRIRKYHTIDGWSTAHPTQPAMFLPGGMLIPPPVDIVVLLPYEPEPEYIEKYVVEARVASEDPTETAKIRAVSFNLQQIGAHDHNSEINTITAPIAESAHPHSIGMDDISPEINDGPHATPVVDSYIPTNMYPDDLELYLFNTKHPFSTNTSNWYKLTPSALHVGGMANSFNLTVSKEDLAVGQNTFWLFSTSSGRGQLTSTYTAYGG